MLFEFFIAKKHICEHKKQSFIGIIGIAIGIIVLTVSIGISNGLNKNMIDSILSLSSHVTVIGNENLKNYDSLENMPKEAKDKLKQVRPYNIGQASRISGVSPADIQVLLMYLKLKGNK